MPKQEHIDEIAGYIRSFENGSKPHNQGHYHSPLGTPLHDCGTAHCLAGWKAYDDAIAAGVKVEWQCLGSVGQYDGRWLKSDDLWGFVNSTGKYWNEETYSRHKWGLTVLEGDRLFGSSLSLAAMKENLRAIAASHGLTCSI